MAAVCFSPVISIQWVGMLSAIARALLQQTHILVAPHHGREDGQWSGFAGSVPHLRWVIISDKGHAHETQRMSAPFYAALAQGWKFGPNSTNRKVLTTRSDGSIAIEVTPQGHVRAWTFDQNYTPPRRPQRPSIKWI